jgi:putative heme iron utilization protein
MPDPITPAISDRICKHMNEDHGDAIALYVRVYGQVAANSARMQSIDPEGMNLLAETDGGVIPVRVTFDHTLQDSEDAHHTLIDMVKQARSKG